MTPHHEKGRHYYECTNCGERTVTDRHLGDCPNCGGTVTNIAVPREQ